MKKQIANDVGLMLETVLGYLEFAKHHCIDKLNKPTLEYIEKAIEHTEIANKYLFEKSLTDKEREALNKLGYSFKDVKETQNAKVKEGKIN